jgi:hypothetical protein
MFGLEDKLRAFLGLPEVVAARLFLASARF